VGNVAAGKRPLQFVDGLEQHHAQSLAALVGLQDERAHGQPPGRVHDLRLADGHDGVRRVEPGGGEQHVLRGLAHLQAQHAAAIDDAAAMPFEPPQHDVGAVRGMAVAAGIVRGAHAAEEDALGRYGAQIEGQFVQEPFLVRAPERLEGLAQRRQPLVVFVDDEDSVVGHEVLALGSGGRFGAAAGSEAQRQGKSE
jgi:hypothetical protein